MNTPRALTFTSSGAVTKYTFAAGNGSAGIVAKAAALTANIIGIFNASNADTGTSVDVVIGGPCKLKLGGAVNIGDRLTADVNGYGVAVSAGVANIGAIAMAKGSSGDIIDVDVQLS